MRNKTSIFGCGGGGGGILVGGNTSLVLWPLHETKPGDYPTQHGMTASKSSYEWAVYNTGFFLLDIDMGNSL